jgi:ABC-2 type transport system permease protein
VNVHAIRAIYRFEMARTFRTLLESILSPVLSTSLYFIVFGAAIGSGTIYELLSAPVSTSEILLGYVGAAATKSMMLGTLILVTARFFVPYEIAHPFWMGCFLVLTALSFSLFGFIVGVWADSFQKLQVIPLLILTPLTFLGGAFYSISMLPPLWQKVALFNPVVYLISGMRWSFYGVSDVNIAVSTAAILAFLALCMALIAWIFRTGYKLKA